MAKQILSGRIANDLELRTAEFNSKEHKVLSNTIFVFDSRAEKDEKGLSKGIPLDFTAWDKNAEEIAQNYKKGDVITFTAQMRGKEYLQGGKDSGYKPITVPYFVVEKIDRDNVISKQFSKEVISYNKGEIDKFGDGSFYEPKELNNEASKAGPEMDIEMAPMEPKEPDKE